jgi:hypothetical protein
MLYLMNKTIRSFIFVLGITLWPVFLYGQRPDSTAKKHLPYHYFSINPLKCGLFQQAGISYGYRPGRFGFEVAAGYIYPSGFNAGRFFIARTSNYGALEFYKGFFLDPQFNFYLWKPKDAVKATICYLSVKGVYKYMFMDSTHYYIWDHETGGDDYWLFAKQVDRLNIMGGFVMFGVKHIDKHFYVDFNIGPGMLALNHNLVVAGEGHDMRDDISNVRPPRRVTFNQYVFTMTMSLSFGVAF